MKRSKAGLVLLIIGVVFIVLAPIWRWGIGPMMVKIPDNIDSPSIYEGTLKLYVDPTSLSVLGEDMAVTVPLTITRIDKSDPAKGTGAVAVIEETADARGPGNKSFLAYDVFFALDRRTALAVPGNNSDRDRTDYTVLLPFGTEKITYKIWDDDVGKSGDLNYVEESTRDGFKNKDVKVFIFKGEGSDPMIQPPLGLPKELTGAQIKTLAAGIPNAPTLTLNDTEMYPITYIKSTTATVAVEPRTGTFNEVAKSEEYSVDTSALGIPNIKLGKISYKQTPESVKWNIDNNAKNFALLNAVEIYIPLALLLLGLIIGVIGLVLFLRKKPA